MEGIEVLVFTALLLIGTWGLCLAVAGFAGRTLTGDGSSVHWETRVAAMWWGLSLATLLTLTLNLILPMRALAGVVVLTILVLVGVVGVITSRGKPAAKLKMTWSGTTIVWVVSIAGTFVVVAMLAAGMPTNYDTGLYHLNAIDYAHDFATIPGLANLHDRLGFNASIYSLAAALSNGLWADQGFRVITGLMLAAMASDASLRVLRRGSRRRPGTAVMVVGTVLLLGYAIQEPGRLIASPVADVMAAVLTIVATAYLLDGLTQSPKRQNLVAAATAIVVACLAATARPLGWVFVGLVISVLVARYRNRLRSGVMLRAGLLGVALLAVMTARDVLLSGWLFYPLGLFPMPVDWRVPDPSLTREAITAWGRAPHMPLETAQNWGAWFPTWVASLPRDWAVDSLALLLLGTAVLSVVLFARHRRWPRLPGTWWWALIPLALTSALWFLTAPDPRFAWGLLVGLGLVPFACAVSASPKATAWLPAVGGVALCCAIALSWTRGGFVPVLKDAQPTPAVLGQWTITLELAPVKPVGARTARISDGTEVIEPAEGLQCWSLFPLCRVPGSNPDIAVRGTSLGEGFRSILIH